MFGIGLGVAWMASSYCQEGPARSPLTRVVAVTIAVLIATTGYVAVDRVIITSRTPRVDGVAPLTTTQRAALSQAGVTHLTQLVGWGSSERWQAINGTLEKNEAESLAQIVALYLHQGIGTTYGNRLAAVGITSLYGLADRDVDDVWQTLKQAEAPGPIPTRAQVKVWLRRLPTKRKCAADPSFDGNGGSLFSTSENRGGRRARLLAVAGRIRSGRPGHKPGPVGCGVSRPRGMDDQPERQAPEGRQQQPANLRVNLA